MTTITVTTTTTDISLAKLIPCPANVRGTEASAGIDALAASIQAHGLLQSLVVLLELTKLVRAFTFLQSVGGLSAAPLHGCRVLGG